MENNIYTPELLIVANEELSYGISHGYYPDFTQAIQNGSLEVCPINQLDNKYKLSKRPIGDGKDFYLWNPSADSYLSLCDSDLLTTLINDKSFAIKEALVRMGAKDIVLKEESLENASQSSSGHNKADIEIASADLKIDYSRALTLEIKSAIESHDPNRTPKDPTLVERFILAHGLANDAKLAMLLNRLKEDGELHGTEKYVVTYFNEIKSALNIAANINYKLFNNSLDFSQEHNHVSTISKSLEINFG